MIGRTIENRVQPRRKPVSLFGKLQVDLHAYGKSQTAYNITMIIDGTHHWHGICVICSDTSVVTLGEGKDR